MRRYVFTIDTFNEGLGGSHWCESLGVLETELGKYPNLALVVIARKSSHGKYKLNRWGCRMQYLLGLENSQDVVNKYSEAYDIGHDKDLFEFKNRLFLSIFCRTYVSMPYYDRGRLRSLGALYRQYIRMYGETVTKAADENPEQSITWRYLC